MMPLLKVFVKRFVVLFHDYYISITTTGESEAVKISSAVVRSPPGVRGKARYVKSGEFSELNDTAFHAAQRCSGRLETTAVGGSFFTASQH